MYYNGKVLGENFFARRKSERHKLILGVLADGVELSTNDLWKEVIKLGYHYDRRTLLKDCFLLEVDGLVFGSTVFGGKGKGTQKFWKVK